MPEPSIQIDSSGYCTRSGDNYLILAGDADACCCGGSPPPPPCGCMPVYYRTSCRYDETELACCQCPNSLDFTMTGSYSLSDTTSGHDYGYFTDSEGVRHDFDYGPYPKVNGSYTLRFSIVIKRRCQPNGAISIDYSGCTWDLTNVVSYGIPGPDEHLTGQAAWNAIVGWATANALGEELDMSEILCGVVEYPEMFLIVDRPEADLGKCSGSWFLSGLGHNGTGFQGANWDMERNCDGGHSRGSSNSYDLDQYDFENSGFAEHRYLERRIVVNGDATWSRTTYSTCETNPCDGPPPAVGACCGVFFSMNGPVSCIMETASGCESLGGTFNGVATSCDGACLPVGACCMPSGICVHNTGIGCMTAGGRFQGADTSCVDNECPPLMGACCLGGVGGTCQVVTQGKCTDLFGVFLGIGSVCPSGPCLSEPVLGCCLPDGSCIDTTADGCAAQGGVSQTGPCSSSSCPQPQRGACCADPGTDHQTCFDGVSESQCQALVDNLPGTQAHLSTYTPDATCAQMACGASAPIYQPNGLISASGAISGPCSSTGFYPCLRGATPDDSMYVAMVGACALEVSLGGGIVPIVRTGHVMQWRFNQSVGYPPDLQSVTAALYQGSTLIASEGPQHSPNAYATFTRTLTEAEASAITDYSDLRIRVTTQYGGAQAIALSWANLQVPTGGPGVEAFL